MRPDETKVGGGGVAGGASDTAGMEVMDAKGANTVATDSLRAVDKGKRDAGQVVYGGDTFATTVRTKPWPGGFDQKLGVTRTT